MRGVRQGDVISPKLLTLALDDVFKKLNCEKKGLKVDGSYLSHLRFADDVVIISSDLDELEKMLQDLNVELKKVGLMMNLRKTKLMSPDARVQILIENEVIETVQEYNYLGHETR